MTTQKTIKKMNERNAFNRLNSGQRFLISMGGEDYELAYVGKRIEKEENERWINPCGISLIREGLIEETTIYSFNFFFQRYIHKKNPLYLWYSQVLDGRVNN